MANDFKALIGVAYDQKQAQSELDRQIKSLQKNTKLALNIELSDKEAKKVLQDSSKMWSNYRKEAVAAISAPNTELQKMGKYYQFLEKQGDSFHKKNINGFDLEIKKQQEQSKINSNLIKSSMQERLNAENKIQLEVKNTAKINQDALNLKSGKTQLDNNISSYLRENTKLSDILKNKLLEIQRQIKLTDGIGLKNLTQSFKTVTSEVNSLGQNGKNVFDKFKSDIGNFLTFVTAGGAIVGSINVIKDMVGNVRDLDDSLVQLRKVSDLSGDSLITFTKQAYEMGSEVARTGKEVIDATTVFKRAGYTLEQSFDLSKVTLIMTNVGDGIKNVDEASSALIATLKGFKLSDTDAMSVIDMINSTSNQAAIDFDNITEGLRRVSGTLSQTGTSIQQTIGLLTGGFGSLRDIEMVSSGIVMISQRLRGVGEDGEAIEGLAAKLQDEFKSIANIDIEDSNGELRSTFDILEDMARVFPTLTSKQRQYLGELAAGNRQIKVLNAITSGWNDVTQAVGTATNSQGSALSENDKVLDSITGKTNAFKSAFQELSATTVNSDLIKFFVDLGTGVLNLTTALGGLSPIVITLGSAFAIHKFLLPILVKEMSALVVAEGGAVSTTMAQIVAQTGLNGAFSVGTTAVSSFITAMLPILGFAAVIAGVAIAYDALNISLKEQQDITTKLNTEYEEIQSKLSDVNTELETTASRMEELNSKENLTFVEKQELENLKETNAQLESQNRLLEEQANIKNQAVAASVAKEFKIDLQDNTNEKTYLTGNTKEYAARGEVVVNKEYANSSEEDYAKNMIVLMDKLNAKKTDGIKLTDEEQSLYDDIRKDLVDTALKYNEYADKYKIDDETSQSWRDFATQIDKTLNPAEYKTNIFDEVFNSSSFATIKTELEDLAKAGELTPEVLSSTKAYAQLLSETGLTAQEVSDQINGSLGTIASTTADARAELLSYKNIIDSVSENVKMVAEAQYELAENEKLSYETVSDLLEVYPELEKSLTLTADGYSVTKGALDDLMTSQTSEYELAYNEAVEAANKFIDNEKLKKAGIDQTTTAVKDQMYAMLKLYEQEKQATGDTLREVQNTPTYQSMMSAWSNVKTTDSNLQKAEKVVKNIQVDTNTTLAEKNKKKTSSSKDDPYLDKYNIAKDTLDHQLAMDEITQKEYLNKLEKLNNKYFAKKKDKYLDQYRSNQEEIYKGRKTLDEKAVEDAKKAAEELLKKQQDAFDKKLASKGDTLDEVDRISLYVDKSSTEELVLMQVGFDEASKYAQELNDEITKLNKSYAKGKISEETYNDRLSSLTDELYSATSSMKKYRDSIVSYMQDIYEAKKDALESDYETENKALEDAFENTEKALNNQLKKYNDIIDAQKKSNDEAEKKYQYEKKVTEQTDAISKIQSDLTDARKDDSREGLQRQRELEEELAKAREGLTDTQHDYEVDSKEDALSKANDLYTDMIEKQIANAKSASDIDIANAKTAYETKLANVNSLYATEEALIISAATLTGSEFAKAFSTINSTMSSFGLSVSDDFKNSYNSTGQTISGMASISSILGDGSKTGQNTSGLSGLNQYLGSKGYSVVDKSKMVELAKALKIEGIKSEKDVGTDEIGKINKNKILAAIKSAGFASGDGVLLDNNMIKQAGENRIFFGKAGEGMLDDEKMKAIREFTKVMPVVKDLIKLNTPDFSKVITNNSSSPTIMFNLTGGTITNEAMPQLNKWKKEIITDIVNVMNKS